MKIESSKIALLIFGILCCNLTFAAPQPPPPIPPTPPGFPIDENLLVLAFASIILVLYKINSYKKASK